MSARELYQRFTGKLTRRVLRTGIRYGKRWLTRRGNLNVLIPEQFAMIGRIRRIEYDCVYDGQAKIAEHVFSPGSRPVLAVGEKPGQAFILGQSYVFTDRGFVDLDSRGRRIVYDAKTGTSRPFS